MKLFLAKLGFVHRRLWQRNGTYRIAMLLGPPPLLGAVLASLFWVGAHALPQPRPAEAPLPPWATVAGPRIAVSTDPPRAVAPGMELPASGMPAGLVVGWQGGIQAVELDSTMDANVKPARLVVSNVQLDLSGPTTLRFEPVPFALQPGLYAIAVAFGCWDNRQERGAGTLTVLIRHPGEQALRPAGADEILRSAAAKP